MVLYYLDSNVFLEGKPLAELPWHDLSPEDPVRLCVVPTVLKEIDKRKRDGRLAERARALNRMLGPAATRGETVIVRDANPRVELFIARVGKLDASELNELDLTEPDVRIVAEAWSHAGINNADKVIVSQDIRPLGVGYQLALRTHHISEDWLAAREPSAAEREAARLQQRVRDLETTQPKLRIRISAPAEPVGVSAFEPLGGAEQYDLQRSILRSNPQQSQSSLMIGYDHDYADKYEHYAEVRLPQFTERIGDIMSGLLSQVPFSVVISNEGRVQAERLVVQIACSSASIHNKYVLIGPSGPKAPVPRDLLQGIHRNLHHAMSPAPGRHEAHFTVPPSQYGRQVEMACEDFRHGRDWCFNGVLLPDHKDERPIVLSVRVTAANLKGELTEHVTRQKLISKRRLDEVINFDTRRFTCDLPTFNALKTGESVEEVVEWLRLEGDDD